MYRGSNAVTCENLRQALGEIDFVHAQSDLSKFTQMMTFEYFALA